MRAIATILYLFGPTCFVLLVCMAYVGWFGFFRMKDQRDALKTKNVQLEKDHKDACQQLNELRANIAGGWPITF